MNLIISCFFRAFLDHQVFSAPLDSLAAMELMVVTEKWVLKGLRGQKGPSGHKGSKVRRENLEQEA